ncbi:MAG: histidine triad nucleotide-binding protein [Acidobacteriia bacterium]|nr:histidine triad nucleotide-binding protein [Terriglobia bacterium]
MAENSTPCLFCRIVRREAPGKIVFEDDLVTAFEDVHPRSPTHVLIVPRKHIESLDALGSEDESLIGHLHMVAAQLARDRGIQKTGYRTVINTGAHAGQSVFHIHLHLLGGRSMAWPPG